MARMMAKWVEEFDISKLSEETKNWLTLFSDALPEAELSQKEHLVPFQDRTTGKWETITETRIQPTEAGKNWAFASEALRTCPEPELLIHTEWLDIDRRLQALKDDAWQTLKSRYPDKTEDELEEIAQNTPLDAQKCHDSFERFKDLEHDLHKLGLRIKDNK